MPQVIFISADGQRQALSGEAGQSVMQLAQCHGLDGVVAECGGAAACATCHVYVDERFLPLLATPTTQEEQMLEFVAAERRPNSRLSCQLTLSDALDGLTVHLPDRQV